MTFPADQINTATDGKRGDWRNVAETVVTYRIRDAGSPGHPALRYQVQVDNAPVATNVALSAGASRTLLDLHWTLSGKCSVEIRAPARGTVIGDKAQVARSFSSSPAQAWRR